MHLITFRLAFGQDTCLLWSQTEAEILLAYRFLKIAEGQPFGNSVGKVDKGLFKINFLYVLLS
jgi:hypothetical protein